MISTDFRAADGAVWPGPEVADGPSGGELTTRFSFLRGGGEVDPAPLELIPFMKKVYR
jgi:hypothetical protein